MAPRKLKPTRSRPTAKSTAAASSLQTSTSEPAALHPIKTAARLARMPQRLVLVYCRHGLVTPHPASGKGELYFNRHAIRTLQRIAFLRSECGMNVAGVELVMKLLLDIEELRAATRR